MNVGNLMILGDSYSTFEGYVPEGNLCYYTLDDETKTGVNTVELTWWHPFVKESGANLVKNESYSGSCICNTGYNGVDCSASSFVGRFDKLAEAGFFKEKQIDTLIIFGGTNDRWSKAPVGETMYENWTAEDLKKVEPAICYLFSRVKEELPETRVLTVINPELWAEITRAMKDAADHYGIEVLEIFEIAKNEGSGHPNIEGMAQIKEHLLDYFA